jgi:translation initiation factor 2 subunit 2
MPEAVTEKHRFEIPKAKGHIQGHRTVISNFIQIAGHFSRKPEHMLKFILKELATPGDIKKGLLILGSKVPASRVNEKIEKYAHEFVLCTECGKPDTRIEEEKGVRFLKCAACGAKHTIKSVI